MTVGEIYDGSVYLCEFMNNRMMKLHDKSTISAGDGVRYETIPGLKYLRNRQAIAARKTLRNGVNQALTGDSTPGTLYARRMEMIPLEVVVRSGFMGSWLERNPTFIAHWDMPEVEFFYKKTYDKRIGGFIDGNDLRMERTESIKALKASKTVFPDPYMLHAGDITWEVHDAHAPLGEALAIIEFDWPRAQMERMALKAFWLLHDAFLRLDCKAYHLDFSKLRLADIKFEFGINPETGEVWLADTVTLDSMRLLMDGIFDKDHQLSKQVFRDGADLKKVKAIYQLGTMLMEAALL